MLLMKICFLRNSLKVKILVVKRFYISNIVVLHIAVNSTLQWFSLATNRVGVSCGKVQECWSCLTATILTKYILFPILISVNPHIASKSLLSNMTSTILVQETPTLLVANENHCSVLLTAMWNTTMFDIQKHFTSRIFTFGSLRRNHIIFENVRYLFTTYLL